MVFIKWKKGYRKDDMGIFIYEYLFGNTDIGLLLWEY